MCDCEEKRIVRSLMLGGITVEAATKIRDLYRDEVANEMGRDCLAVGAAAFLRKLVGGDNADALIDRLVNERQAALEKERLKKRMRW